MWKAVTEFLLELHAQGLGHEAVIEIMIALLGVMLTVAALVVAFASWFGYESIKREAVKQAKKAARKIALETTRDVYRTFLLEEGAAEYSESQKDITPDDDDTISLAASDSGPKVPPAKPKGSGKRTATSDSNLKRTGRKS